jgi:dTDP-4-dehydrorhamnose 3,5-epimerase
LEFVATSLDGAFLIRPEPIEDDRGYFARRFCQKEFAAHGLNACVAQTNVSLSRRSGTLRGMHYQASPFEEARVVWCLAGSIYDVIVDLREASSTRWRWAAFELDAASGTALYIPEGFAHGYLTRADDTIVYYQMSEFYHPERATGFRWDDPAVDIVWPAAPTVISERDRSYPPLRGAG